MPTITIKGKQFTVEPRYAEGHTLTANEASALNQTYFENLRNNFANKAEEGGTQEDFTAYAQSYQFGVRTGGGSSRDPIEVEAMALARDKVRAAIVKAGKKVSDFTAAAITAQAAKQVEANPQFREMAKQRVALMQSMAVEGVEDSDLLSGIEEKAEGEEGATGEESGDSGETDEAAGVADAEATTAEGAGKRRRGQAA